MKMRREKVNHTLANILTRIIVSLSAINDLAALKYLLKNTYFLK